MCAGKVGFEDDGFVLWLTLWSVDVERSPLKDGCWTGSVHPCVIMCDNLLSKIRDAELNETTEISGINDGTQWKARNG